MYTTKIIIFDLTSDAIDCTEATEIGSRENYPTSPTSIEVRLSFQNRSSSFRDSKG